MSNKINHCEKCDGEGWLWNQDLTRHFSQGYNDDTRYRCDECRAKPDPDMAQDRELAAFDPVI